MNETSSENCFWRIPRLVHDNSPDPNPGPTARQCLLEPAVSGQLPKIFFSVKSNK